MITEFERKLISKLNVSEGFFELLKDNTIAGEEGQVLVRIDTGVVIRRCTYPSVLAYFFNTPSRPLPIRIFRIDDYIINLRYLTKTKEILATFGDEVAQSVSDSLRLIELPRNQLLVDSIHNNEGYLDNYLNRFRQLIEPLMSLLNNPVELES